MRLKRLADGDVALDGERRDGEHGRVRGHLGEQRLDDTKRLAEPPRVALPDRVRLGRKTCKQKSMK